MVTWGVSSFPYVPAVMDPEWGSGVYLNPLSAPLPPLLNIL